jgi:hypothetical protein
MTSARHPYFTTPGPKIKKPGWKTTRGKKGI